MQYFFREPVWCYTCRYTNISGSAILRQNRNIKYIHIAFVSGMNFLTCNSYVYYAYTVYIYIYTYIYIYYE